MSSAEIEHSILHSILSPAENAFNFFDIQYFYLTFAFNFADLDPSWRLPGSLPGHLLVFPWCPPGVYLVSNLDAEKHSISRVLRHSTFGTEGLQAILKGANRKKPFNFQLTSRFLAKTFNFPGVYQVWSWCL